MNSRGIKEIYILTERCFIIIILYLKKSIKLQ